MRILLAIAALFAAQPSLAQTSEDRPAPPAGRPAGTGAEGLSVTIGVAPVLAPAWEGSRDMTLSVFPDLRLNYEDKIFASIPEGIGWNMVNQDGWKVGPLAQLRFGRDEDQGGSPFVVSGGSDALLGLGDIDAAVELGGFVEKQAGAWRGRVEVRRGFGGHEGVIADGSLVYQVRSGRTILSGGPRATLASSAYLNTYFGIDAVQAQRSGLAAYAASGGLVSYGLGATLVRPLGQRSALTLFTGWDRLGSAAGNSPLIRERGQRGQFSLGVGYGFRFGL